MDLQSVLPFSRSLQLSHDYVSQALGLMLGQFVILSHVSGTEVIIVIIGWGF